ncbi:MAG: GNAT family N-acetyltransferase [Solirubrobacterales bacterium]|nr:GNAT family N-acetyltransferase [Solirubrobacterales bacterium]
MHSQLTYIAAQQRAADLKAESARASRSGTNRLVLLDGRRLTIRPVERDDGERLRGLFARLAPESRYRRFLSPKPELTEREVADLTDIDHVRHEALAAIDEIDGSFVAAARYVQRSDQPGVAEGAIEVADELHNMGIGTALVSHTSDRARANGVTRLTAITLRDNRASRALLRSFGFRPRCNHGSELEFELELEPLLDAH